MMFFDGDGEGGGKSDGGYLYFFQNFFVVVLCQLYMLSVDLRSTSSLQSSACEKSCAPFLLHSPFIVKKNPHGNAFGYECSKGTKDENTPRYNSLCSFYLGLSFGACIT